MTSRRAMLHALGIALAIACASPVRADAPPPSAAAGAGAPAPAAAEQALPAQHVPELQVGVEPRAGVRTGELVHVRVTAQALVGDDVTVVDQSFAPFEVHKKRARVEAPVNGKQSFVFELDLLAFEPGDAPIPALDLRVVTKDGLVGDVQTSAVPFSVRSRIANEPNAQPKHETKPVVVMQDNFIPLYVLGALLAIALVAGATLFVQKKLRERKARELPPPPPRPAWDVAIEKLAELRRHKQQMLEEGKGALFVDQLSDVLREYLGGRFGFDGLETTSDEMLALLAYREAGVTFTQEVGQFLRRCDLVKFAKATPDQDEVDLLFGKAQELVQNSQPRPAPQPLAAASTGGQPS